MRKSWMLQVKASRLLPEGHRSELVRESASVIGKNTSIEKPSSRTSSLLRPSARIKNHIATLVPTLRVVMPFVTLCVTALIVMRKSWMLQVKASMLLPEGRRSELVREGAASLPENISPETSSSRTSSLVW
ncbi:hypothetical protein PsP108CL_13490 [Pseudomonas syringae]|nr:hypothetical protein [Pseudomonas syringae]